MEQSYLRFKFKMQCSSTLVLSDWKAEIENTFFFFGIVNNTFTVIGTECQQLLWTRTCPSMKSKNLHHCCISHPSKFLWYIISSTSSTTSFVWIYHLFFLNPSISLLTKFSHFLRLHDLDVTLKQHLRKYQYVNTSFHV